MSMDTAFETQEALETLMQFLYRAPVGLVQTTLDGEIEMINPMSAQLLLPLSPNGALQNLFEVLATLAPQLGALVASFDQSSGAIFEGLRLPLPAQSTAGRPQVLSLSLVRLDARRLMAMVMDVTLDATRESEVLAIRLTAASLRDTLTGLPNRAGAIEAIRQAATSNAPGPGCNLAVIYINCDRFTQVNDHLGHAAGDEILRTMAERVRSTLRAETRGNRKQSIASVAARIGGDEFAVILSDLYYPEDVHVVAQRLVEVLQDRYTVGSRQVHCTASMGVLLQCHVGADPDAVLHDAFVAMREAKRAGGARYAVFEPSMGELTSRRSSMESELRRAIDENELFLVYQPVVGLQTKSGCVDRQAGVEALVRWRHPTRGIVPPLEFISIAEACGLIGALGDYVLIQACRDFASWQQRLGANAPGLLAVNLSRGQLSQPDFVESVSQALRNSGMVARQLQLEVTESLAAQDLAVRSTLKALRSLGLSLALDDFGTGYSSLASLHLLPVTTIKIDRSFIGEAVESKHHRVLIEATVRVADSLGMGTVAEGIENKEQAALIAQLGCTKGQGYFFCKPLLSAALCEWLQKVPDVEQPITSA